MDKAQKRQDEWVINQLSKIKKNSLLLDVGAGGCRYKDYCAHLYYESQDFCKVYEKNLGGYKYAEHNYVCDILNIPVGDSKYDAILCTEVLEHVPEPIKVVFELSRLLKPGGKLILTAPLCSGLHQKPFHFYGGYTPYWYEKFLSEAGFHKIICANSGGFFFWHAHYSERAEIYLRKAREAITINIKMTKNINSIQISAKEIGSFIKPN